MANMPPIEIASVKVMRSHDYCHFEVCLSSSSANTIEQVDELRKTAARLADKAVVQYRIAKANAAKLAANKLDRLYLSQKMEAIRKTPEQERTVKEQADLKAFDDAVWEAGRSYDYEDDWSEDEDY